MTAAVRLADMVRQTSTSFVDKLLVDVVELGEELLGARECKLLEVHVNVEVAARA